jgi:ABC-type branched-subunit amino acid transport system ATPase component/ABC-type branched-subunit amino acid transport system permease subunit
MTPVAARRWAGHAGVILGAVVGAQLAMGRLGGLGSGDRTIPAEVLGVGLVVGALYGLVGVGMVLVWRSHRLLNLAQAQIGAVPAVAALLLVSEHGWPYLPAVVLAVAVAAVLGAGAERAIVRRFDDAPRLAATIATLGLAQLLVAVELLLPRWLSDRQGLALVPDTPFSDWHRTVGVVTFTGDHLAALVAGLGLSALVAVGLRRSHLGLAVRAVAARPVQAAQLGLPVARLRGGVWALAAVASALAVLLRVPLVGFPLGGLVGPGTLLFGLAAATIARFDDPVRALVAGMAVGVVEQGAVFSGGRSTTADIAILLLVVGALAVQRSTRGRLAEVGAWLPAREVPSLPSAVWWAPKVRAVRVVTSTALAALVFALPPLLPAGQATRMTALCAFGVIAVATVILTGWSGQLGLGQIGVAGVGAAVAGGLVTGGGVTSDLFIVVALAAVAGASTSVAIGLPTLRASGPQLAITTLALAFAIPALMASPDLTGWLMPDGPVERPVLFDWIDLTPERRFTYLALTLLVVAVAFARRLRGSRAGRLVVAGRDDLRAVAGVATEPWRVRVFAFAVSGGLAGGAGALIAWNQGVVEPATFAPQRSLDIVAAVVIGGISSVSGALLGVLWVFGLPMVFPGSPYVAALGSGVGVLAVLLVQPGGLAVILGRWWRSVAVRLAGTDPSATARGGSAGRFTGVADALAEAGFAPRSDAVIERLDLYEETDEAEHATAASAIDDAPAAHVVEPAGPGTVLALDGLTVRRGADVVIRDLTLHVEAGECVALVGTNGAGKSTLLAAIAGGLRPRLGHVHIKGIGVTGAAPGVVASLGVAVHPGVQACFPDLTVAEHLRLAARYTERPSEQAIAEVYGDYPRLDERRHVPAGALSGGERHLLAFALASLRRPDLLLVDELSLGLAPDTLAELVVALSRFRATGCTVVVVDQRLHHLAEVADRAVFLERGEIRYDGPVAGLLADDRLLRPVLSSGEPRATAAAPDELDPIAGPALEVEGVSVAYGEVPVLAGISLAVNAGSVVGLIGGNGAGKTTLLDAIAGSVDHGGTIRMDGADLAGRSPAARARRGLGRSFQAGSGLDALTVRECLALAQDRSFEPRSLAASVLAMPAATIAETDTLLRSELLAADAGLLEWRDTPSGDLSTGLRRRLELHMTAAHDPSVLLLDEPTSGVAAAEIPAIVSLVRLIAMRGAAVVVVDHDHDFIAQVADQVVELVEGRVAAAGAAAAPSDR